MCGMLWSGLGYAVCSSLSRDLPESERDLAKLTGSSFPSSYVLEEAFTITEFHTSDLCCMNEIRSIETWGSQHGMLGFTT